MPAWGKTCGKCRGSNHFAEMCKTKIVNAFSVSEESLFNSDVHGNMDKEGGAPAQLPDNEINLQTVYILGMLATEEKNQSVWKVPLIINGTSVVCRVDTGAEVSVLPRVVYDLLHQRPKLQNQRQDYHLMDRHNQFLLMDSVFVKYLWTMGCSAT